MSKKDTYKLKTLALLVLATEIVFWSAAISIWLFLQENVEEFRMERTWALKGLFVLPLLSILFYLDVYRKNKSWKKFAPGGLSDRLHDGFSTIKTFLRFFLWRLALAMLIIAYGNPQYGKNKKEALAEGIDLMIGLDVSNSMLAEDMAGEMSRLRIAKLSIEKLLNKLHGDRIGLVVFAGSAYTQLPITTDYSAARLFLSGITTSMISAQGTAIGGAIDTCMNAFDFQSETKKAIIIISDGENHEDDALGAAQRAKEKGVLVNTVGVGSEKGSPIPHWEGNQKSGVKRDREGNTVISRLNEQMLKEIAAAGEGTYTKASGSDLGLDKLVKNLNTLEKTEYATELYTDYEDQFQVFVLIALVLIALEQFITVKKSKWLEHFFSV